jgi:hypothetical protein
MSRGPTDSSEVTMPYATGEIPVPGDYVKNQFERTGTVTKVRIEFDDHDFVSIRWDDGGPDLPLMPAKEFTLISRKPSRSDDVSRSLDTR